MNGRNALQEELMTTIKLTIEYDGSRYPGFSTKKKSTSIESKLTLAIRDVTGQSTQLFAAVKTEPGVHAVHQIVSKKLYLYLPDCHRSCRSIIFPSVHLCCNRVS